MTDRIDPGPGWRLLRAGEVKPRGYEYKSSVLGWAKGAGVGDRVLADGFPCRVRIAPIATKAIATRATVRTAFDGGTTITRTMRNDEGLSEREMMDVSEVFFDKVEAIRNRTSVPKYIMLEIQREGEP